MRKTTVISFILGLAVSSALSFMAYQYINRLNQNEYVKAPSRFYDSLEILQHRYDDVKLTSQPHRKTKMRAALVAIDDASIEEVGRWPWSRETMQLITTELLRNEVKAVGFDILFSEPERNNPNEDKNFGLMVEKNAEKIVLATSGAGIISSVAPPYQDICYLEAMYHMGGEGLIKPNITFIVDDETENFETIDWKQYFLPVFEKIEQLEQAHYLKQLNSESVKNLTQLQQNALKSNVQRSVYNYCTSWLTSSDPVQRVGFDLGTVEKIKKIKAHPIRQYLRWLSNVPPMQDPSMYTAAVNTDFDSSGLVRHYHLFNRIGFRIGSSYIPSLATQLYLISQGKRAEVLISADEKQNQKYIKQFVVKDLDDEKSEGSPLKADLFGRIRINYLSSSPSVETISAKDLLYPQLTEIVVQYLDQNGQLAEKRMNKKEFLKDRVVIVGATSTGVGDIRNTPVQIAMPGPETHINALANLIDQNYILDIQNANLVIPIITFCLGLLFTLICTVSASFWSTVSFFALIGVLYFVDQQLFIYKKIMTTTWPLYFMFGAVFFVIIVFRYFTEERDRQKIKKTFSKYVAPAVVDELLKSESNLALGGRKQNLTVFFSDLRGFTTFSEKLTPEQLSTFLNIYFTKMTNEVFKVQGTLDKFIGDAVMAFFGAPVALKNNAENACHCALRCLQQLKILNKEYEKMGFPQLDMGIGLNTGDMSVGNMGSETLQNYTVLGDAVNLASRLEGLNKDYGTHIIVGPTTFEKTKELFVYRELDWVRVKGKTEAVRIYELLAKKSEQTPQQQQWLDVFAQAKAKYLEKSFSDAKDLFEQAQQINPLDKASLEFIARCENYIKSPPASDWDGVYNLDHK